MHEYRYPTGYRTHPQMWPRNLELCSHLLTSLCSSDQILHLPDYCPINNDHPSSISWTSWFENFSSEEKYCKFCLMTSCCSDLQRKYVVHIRSSKRPDYFDQTCNVSLEVLTMEFEMGSSKPNRQRVSRCFINRGYHQLNNDDGWTDSTYMGWRNIIWWSEVLSAVMASFSKLAEDHTARSNEVQIKDIFRIAMWWTLNFASPTELPNLVVW